MAYEVERQGDAGAAGADGAQAREHGDHRRRRWARRSAPSWRTWRRAGRSSPARRSRSTPARWPTSSTSSSACRWRRGRRRAPGVDLEEVPGGTVACTMHTGPYSTIGEAYGALQALDGGQRQAARRRRRARSTSTSRARCPRASCSPRSTGRSSDGEEVAMSPIDLVKQLKPLYAPSAKHPAIVEVPGARLSHDRRTRRPERFRGLPGRPRRAVRRRLHAQVRAEEGGAGARLQGRAARGPLVGRRRARRAWTSCRRTATPGTGR